MGDKYSKEEKKEVDFLKNLIDKALNDDNKYEEYEKTLKIIIDLFNTKKKNIEKYTIDYIKFLIKNPNIKNKMKFRGLLFLKDLMKKNFDNLLKYTSIKILDRLFIITNSKSKEKCLLEYNKESNLEYSTRFYFLLLECFDNWGKKFAKKEKKFKKYYDILLKRHLLPATEVYYNFPHNQIIYERNKTKNLNFLKEQIFKFIRMREDVQTFILKEFEKENFFIELKKNYQSYRDFFISMKSKKINNIIKQNNGKKSKVILGNLKLEKQLFVEFEKIFSNYEKENKLDLFFKDFKNINKNILNKDIDIEKILKKIGKEKKEEIIKEKKIDLKEETIKEEKNEVKKENEFFYKIEDKELINIDEKEKDFIFKIEDNKKDKDFVFKYGEKEKKISDEKTENEIYFEIDKIKEKNSAKKNENEFYFEMDNLKNENSDGKNENEFYFKMTEKDKNINYKKEKIEKKIDFEFTLKKKDLNFTPKLKGKENKFEFEMELEKDQMYKSGKKNKKNNSSYKNSSVKKKSKFYFKDSKKINTSNEFEIHKNKNSLNSLENSDIDTLEQKNYDLENNYKKLELKKKKLLNKIKNLENEYENENYLEISNTTDNSKLKRFNDFNHLLKNKNYQISNLEKKIQSLEDEVYNINPKVDSIKEFSYLNQKKSNRSFRENSNFYLSKNKENYFSSRLIKKDRKRGGYKNIEKSGTMFINDMYSSFNEILKK